MPIIDILDADDARIAVYRNLKDRQLRRDRLFIAEGKFILETLLTRARFEIASVFVSHDRLLPLELLLHRVPDSIPVYTTSPAIMAEIAGYSVHRGVLAAGIAHDTDDCLPGNMDSVSAVAVLSNIANPDNIGAIFRNAAGLGIEAVLLDAQCCSPLYRKAIRVSMGATLVLPWAQIGTAEDMIGNLTQRGFTCYALSLQSATRLEEVPFARRSALVFGEEAHGLPRTVQAMCEAVTIPMAAGTDSLNVAATSAVVFDAVRRQRG